MEEAHNELHQLIQSHRWDLVLQSLQDDNDNTRSQTKDIFHDNLPLHLAIEHEAPENVILELIKHNEDAVRHSGRFKNFPLHLACRHEASCRVIETIIRINPSVLDIVDSKSFTPREYYHTDYHVRQQTHRPTYCWIDLMENEKKDEVLQNRLNSIKAGMNGSCDAINKSNDKLMELKDRIRQNKMKLNNLLDLEELKSNNASEIDQKVSTSLNSLEEQKNAVENQMGMLLSKRFVSDRANHLREKEINRLQNSTLNDVKILARKIDTFKAKIKAQLRD